MGEFFNDTMQGLLEAVEIEKGPLEIVHTARPIQADSHCFFSFLSHLKQFISPVHQTIPTLPS